MNRTREIVIPVLMFLFLVTMASRLPGMEFDLRNGFQNWALYIYRNGLRNAYGATEYMPVFQYILWAYIKLTGTEDLIIQNMPYLRCFTLLFDFAALWYLFKWIDRRIAYSVILVLCILNIAYSYDTLIWGQVDGILSALVFVAVYYAWKGNNLLAAIFLVLAFNFKIQTIIIIPVWGILFLRNALGNKVIPKVVVPIIAAAVVQVVIFMPFAWGHYGINDIWNTVTNSFNRFQSVSIKAANMWHWFVPGILLYKSDAGIFLFGLTYKQFGLILFFLSSCFALLPAAKLLLAGIRTKKDISISREMVWITGSLLYLLFYFFNTEIHERYCQPAFIFIAAYGFFTGRYFAFAVFSIMYFLTLEVSMQHFHLPNYETLIFDFRFLAALTAIIIVYLYYRLYTLGKGTVDTSTIQTSPAYE